MTVEDLDKIIEGYDRHGGLSKEDLRAMLREAIQASWAWRPMETAPYEGHVLLRLEPGPPTVGVMWLTAHIGRIWVGPDGDEVQPTGWLPLPPAQDVEK